MTEKLLFNNIQEYPYNMGWSNNCKPLYCLAYIDPLSDLSEGMVEEISKYPLAIVPQDGRDYYKTWRDTIRKNNPNITILGYEMVIEETTVPGPGHDILMQAAGNWVEYNGVIPTSSYHNMRFFDPRSEAWQDCFIRACNAVFEDYDYDGLFLDQCFAVETPIEGMQEEMEQAIQKAINKVRLNHPDKIIIANSSKTWGNINGEMNEGRLEDLESESNRVEGHSEPRIELFYHYLQNNDVEQAKEMFRVALWYNCFFGCAPDAQTIEYYSWFEDVLAELKPAPPSIVKIGENQVQIVFSRRSWNNIPINNTHMSYCSLYEINMNKTTLIDQWTITNMEEDSINTTIPISNNETRAFFATCTSRIDMVESLPSPLAIFDTN